MVMADRMTYLAEIVAALKAEWPANRTVNVVCHGHSVPAGYFATPTVNTLDAYPHLLHARLKHRFPFAVVNVIVTAIGGESSESGAARFEPDALTHRPDVVTIDYGLNDRGIGLATARAAWTRMVDQAKARGVKVLLLTPTWDATQRAGVPERERRPLADHAEQIRQLATEHAVGLVDSFAAFGDYAARGGDVGDLLSWTNHPNRAGHELVARELLRWFPIG